MLYPEDWNKAKIPSLTTSIQHCTAYASSCSKARNKNEFLEIQKEKGKFSLFAGHIIVYIQYTKNKILSEYGKMVDNKVNTENQLYIFYYN